LKVGIFYSVLTFIQSQEARGFSQSLKDGEFIRLLIWLPVNSASRETEEIKETKGSLHAAGVKLAEKISWHASLVLSHHSKTHTGSHTLWHNGHAATLLPVSLNKERKGNATVLLNGHCGWRAGQRKAWQSKRGIFY